MNQPDIHEAAAEAVEEDVVLETGTDGSAPTADSTSEFRPARRITDQNPAKAKTFGARASDAGRVNPDGTHHGEAGRVSGENPGDPPEQLELKVCARLYGEPILDLPQDLFIPPDALEVILDAFEGPLDLLLYLIRRQNFDIFDIPMAEVTRQYLVYIDEIRNHNLELAAEYLLMAALLISIKSRMLLPIKKADSDEDVEDPRAELARRLIEYERIKYGAEQIDRMPQIGRDFFAASVHVEHIASAQLPEVSADDLHDAWQDILRRARLVQHHKISREELSVREYMTIVLRQLQNRRFAEFGELFEAERGVSAVVVTFIALLELARESVIEVTQAESFAPIYVRLAGQQA